MNEQASKMEQFEASLNRQVEIKGRYVQELECNYEETTKLIANGEEDMENLIESQNECFYYLLFICSVIL